MPKKKQAQLPEEVGMYVDALRADCPSIAQVWLLNAGAPAATRAHWDLLAFADTEALQSLRANEKWHRADVTFLVATNDDEVEAPWGDAAFTRLSDVEWRLEDADSAAYVDPGSGGQRAQAAALRVR